MIATLGSLERRRQQKPVLKRSWISTTASTPVLPQRFSLNSNDLTLYTIIVIIFEFEPIVSSQHMCRLYCKRVGLCTERDSNISELDRDLESLIRELDLDLESLMEGGRVHHRGCSLSPESREVSFSQGPSSPFLITNTLSQIPKSPYKILNDHCLLRVAR